MTTRIRTATEEELSFLGANDTHVQRDELERIVHAGRVLIAEENQRPVGLARWGLFWDEVPFLNMLFVVAADRGRGIGTSLIGGWEVKQREAGHQAVLTSTLASEGAQHLYRRLGYVDIGCLLLPGEPLEILLRKSLVT